jgi:hypothetical protein
MWLSCRPWRFFPAIRASCAHPCGARFARIRKTFVKEDEEGEQFFVKTKIVYEGSASPHLDLVATKAAGFCPKGERMDARVASVGPKAHLQWDAPWTARSFRPHCPHDKCVFLLKTLLKFFFQGGPFAAL